MQVVAVFSVKGGVGKTTTAVNLAWEASCSGRTLLWDLDPQGGATWLLDVKPKLKGGAEALVTGHTPVKQSIRSSSVKRLDVLPADASYRDLDLVLDDAKKSKQRLTRVLDDVAKRYDTVVLDCPPSSSVLAANVLRAADTLVVPLIPNPLAERSLEQVQHLVSEAKKAPVLHAFCSMVDRRKPSHRREAEELAKRSPVVDPVIVPLTAAVERMATARAPLATFDPRSPAAVAYHDLWETVRAR